MVDFIIDVAGFGSAFLPPSVFAVAFFLTRKGHRLSRRIVSALCFGLAPFTALTATWMGILVGHLDSNAYRSLLFSAGGVVSGLALGALCVFFGLKVLREDATGASQE